MRIICEDSQSSQTKNYNTKMIKEVGGVGLHIRKSVMQKLFSEFEMCCNAVAGYSMYSTLFIHASATDMNGMFETYI